jgi:hypothetical protein
MEKDLAAVILRLNTLLSDIFVPHLATLVDSSFAQPESEKIRYLLRQCSLLYQQMHFGSGDEFVPRQREDTDNIGFCCSMFL